MLIQFVVPGQPVGKGRPRFRKQGEYVQTYTPKETKEYEAAVKWAYKNIAGSDKGFAPKVPVRIMIKLSYQIPSSTSRKQHKRMLDGEVRPCVKPDVDNCVKAICDALNGTAFYDDNQIVELWVSKHYSDDPCAEVTLSDV